MPICRRVMLALVATVPLLGSACLGATDPGTILDCSTLAASIATTTNLTTTASGLRFRDVVVGSGADIAPGSRVVTHYAACVTTGQVFSEVSGPSLFTFTVGQGQVIPGLDEGVTGMKLGGRRQLVIPASLGYGTSGSPGGFAVPNETVVMTVDVIGLR